MITQVALDFIAQQIGGLRECDWKLLKAIMTGDAVEMVNVLST
jgi:hypothetical protein